MNSSKPTVGLALSQDAFICNTRVHLKQFDAVR
jgi:hypothetical protein